MSDTSSLGHRTDPDVARRRGERFRTAALVMVIVVAAGVLAAIATGAFWVIPAFRVAQPQGATSGTVTPSTTIERTQRASVAVFWCTPSSLAQYGAGQPGSAISPGSPY